MTLDTFNVQMGRLAGLKFRPADLTTHWEALNDLPDVVLEAAVSRAQRTRAEFPTPVELRQDADQVKPNALPVEPVEDRSISLAQPFTITVPEAGTIVSVTREWKYYCDDCSDGGWFTVWCGDEKNPSHKPWYQLQRCERRAEHGSHKWMRRCVCYDMNPALVRKREAARKFTDLIYSR